MTTSIVFQDGDLVELTWTYAGDAEVDGPLRVRAVVAGFRVGERGDVSVLLRAGRREVDWQAEADGGDATVTTTQLDVPAEPKLMWIALDYLLGDEADLELVRRGNPVASIDPYVMDDA